MTGVRGEIHLSLDQSSVSPSNSVWLPGGGCAEQARGQRSQPLSPPTPTPPGCMALRMFTFTQNVFTRPMWGHGKKPLAFI